MAARESQGLQVALILFVMVTVVLAVTTYVYFRKAEDKIKEAQEARTQAQVAQKSAKDAQFETQVLKHMLGYERKTEAELTGITQGLQGSANKPQIDQFLEDFKRDMGMYGAGYESQNPPPAEPLSYRALPKYLSSVINTKNSQLAAATVTQRKLEGERDAARAEEGKRRTEAEQAMQAAQTQLMQEKTNYDAERQRLLQQYQQTAAMIPVKDKALQDTTASLQGRIQQLDRQLNETQQLYDNIKAWKLGVQEPTFEQADGVVTMVNERSSIVWVNLGLADGVQKMMNFNVVDQNSVGVAKADSKGSLEITKVLEDHLSEARIVEQSNLANPVMKGDLIYSTSFRRGEKTRFALAGLMDINGDGVSDREKIKSIITTNGGVVDAELLEDGTISGKMTVETKYLVKGERPDDKTQEKFLQNYSVLTGEATKLGIPAISVTELLERMGHTQEVRVVPLGRGGAATQPTTGGSQFRPRTPPQSAY